MQPSSIIIPTFQEGAQLETLLTSLTTHLKEQLANCEIIIVNNGSADITDQDAQKFNAHAYNIERSSVGAARNYGASMSTKDMLIFLDADMEITKEWADEIQKTSITLKNNPLQITGYKVSIPSQPCWLEKHWFCDIPDQEINYINSANLIISRVLFNRLGGFNEKLTSGEDYDLSIRAKNIGATLTPNPALKAIHHGYPQNIYNFIKREIWHGSGDFVSLRSILSSKVALASLIFILMHITLAASLIFSKIAAVTIAITLFTFLFLLSIKKYSKMPLTYIAINTCIYYFYFAGRSISFIKSFLSRIAIKPAYQ